MDAERILLELTQAGVEFVIVGGVGAVLQGVPTTTFDLDIVPSLAPENRVRLMKVLDSLEACYREHLPKRLIPSESDVAAGGHMLMMTSAGPLDVLGQVTGGLRYEDLLPRCLSMDLEGVEVSVLDLAALIELKEQTGRDKDLAQLPVLRRTLEERGT
jgi:predicted nucleotidyltransferase